MSNEKKESFTWEAQYQRETSIPRVPYTEVITFLLRHFKGDCKGKRLLEIGCGVGNNLVFCAWDLGFDISGIDISETAIEIAKKRFEENNLPYRRLEAMDAATLDFESGEFDAVIDRGAMLCNTYDHIQVIMAEVQRVLKPGGCFYSTAASQDHYLFGLGEYLGNGAYKDDDRLGVRQFFSNHQIRDLLDKDFEITEWRKISDFNMKTNSLIATTHHVGCIRK